VTRSTQSPLRHLTYANVMATLALFLVVAGGTAFASVQMRAGHTPAKKHHHKKHHPKKHPVAAEETVVKDNTVDSAAVQDGSLRSADLADGNGVTGADVVPGSLTGSDLADGSIAGAQLAPGSLSGADLSEGLITGDKLEKGSIGSANLAPNSIGLADLVPLSLSGNDVATEGLTGASINEATLGRVPETKQLGNFSSEAFLTSEVETHETTIKLGKDRGDGTFTIMEECPGGHLVINAGPANLNAGTELLSSAPLVNGNWEVTINPHGASDSFNLIMLCVPRTGVTPK
jgi:hypothetical protein